MNMDERLQPLLDQAEMDAVLCLWLSGGGRRNCDKVRSGSVRSSPTQHA